MAPNPQRSRVVVNPLSRNSACENCRMRKIRCTGERTGCEACKKLAKGGDVSQICIFPPERVPSSRRKSTSGEDRSGQTLRTPPGNMYRQRRGSSAGTSNSDHSTPPSSIGSSTEFENLLAFSPNSSSSSGYPTANSSPYLAYADPFQSTSPQNGPYPIALIDPSGQKQQLEFDHTSSSYGYPDLDQQAYHSMNPYSGPVGSHQGLDRQSEEYRQLVQALLIQQYNQPPNERPAYS